MEMVTCSTRPWLPASINRTQRCGCVVSSAYVNIEAPLCSIDQPWLELAAIISEGRWEWEVAAPLSSVVSSAARPNCDILVAKGSIHHKDEGSTGIVPLSAITAVGIESPLLLDTANSSEVRENPRRVTPTTSILTKYELNVASVFLQRFDRIGV